MCMSKRKIVAVKYLDHALFSRDEVEEPRLINVVSVGIMDGETEDALYLIQNSYELSGSETMVIFKPAVKEIIELGEVELEWES